MATPFDLPALRQCVLAASVIDGVDVVPHSRGIRLGSEGGPLVPWTELAPIAGDYPLASATARMRVAAFLGLRTLVHHLGHNAAWRLRTAARLVALPADHVAHGGRDWVIERLPGGTLDLGLGVVGLLGDPDAVHILPTPVLRACEVDGREWWSDVRDHADKMGGLAVSRLARDSTPAFEPHRGSGAPREIVPWQRVLRPVGGCDVLALLASRTLRRYLAGEDRSGMRAVAVPMRSRGWFDLCQIDPAFTAAAWAATDEIARGVRRPLLITEHEVAQARDRRG
ncbi:MAG: hypothetical protein GXX79_09005 [Actinomycetales bacterium]|nr:hypothetical protein [Actinomycetales bacterium]